MNQYSHRGNVYSSLMLIPLFSASAAKDAVGDKIDQTSHDGKAEAHKQRV